ncbi:MAG: diguanylate cyclase [Rhodoferax sp.]|nr:diguanylate cyclase [Rhodoferax sp.]
MKRRLASAILCALCILSALAAQAEQVLRVGITSFRDKQVTYSEWQPTMDYLSARIPGTRFEVVPLNLPEFEGALQAKSLDFLITNPQHYIAVESKYAVSRAATLVKSENGHIVNRFGGVIFTRADRSDISTLAQVKGKRVAATDKTSFAAYLIQYDVLKAQGVDLETDCQTRYLGFPQDLSVQAVLTGSADVGFVRSGLLESMAREGKLDLAKIKVLNRMHSADFPFLVSSALYPEWPLAAAPHVSVDITNQVVAALLLMPAQAPAAQSGRYYRWSTPVEYLSVQALMQRHHIYPFDAPDEVTLSDVLHEYAMPLALCASTVALALALLYWRAYRLNADLVQSRRALRDMAHHDALTGLPNRTLLDDRLEQVLAQADRGRHTVALCMLDLDGFKPINDSFGHDTGDRVLKDVARRIASVLRGCDTVARFGGDEFVLLVNGFGDGAVLEEVMVRVLAAVALAFDYCEQARVTASIGVSVYQRDARDATMLLRHADEAMYQAKAAGGNRFVIYQA